MIGKYYHPQSHKLLIADIGAVGGIDPRWKRFSKALEAILFEPDPRSIEGLRAMAPKNWKVINAALGLKNELRDLHLCARDQCSSFLKPDLNILGRWPNPERFRIEKTIKLETRSLDEVVRTEKLGNIDFIKVDTQGSELDILRGSKQTLANVIGVEVEVEFVPIYKGQPLFADICAYLNGLGFELFDIKRCNWIRHPEVDQARGQIVFGDALFLRPPECELFGEADSTFSAFSIYSAYGYFDLVLSLIKRSVASGLVGKSDGDRIVSALGIRNRPWLSRLSDRALRAFPFVKKHRSAWDDGIGGCF